MPKHLHENHLGAGLSFDGNLLVSADAGPQAFSVFLSGDLPTGLIADLILSMPQAGTIHNSNVRSGAGSGSALLLVNGTAIINQFQTVNTSGTTLTQNIVVAAGDRVSAQIFVALGSLSNVTYQVTWSPGS